MWSWYLKKLHPNSCVDALLRYECLSCKVIKRRWKPSPHVPHSCVCTQAHRDSITRIAKQWIIGTVEIVKDAWYFQLIYRDLEYVSHGLPLSSNRNRNNLLIWFGWYGFLMKCSYWDLSRGLKFAERPARFALDFGDLLQQALEKKICELQVWHLGSISFPPRRASL